MDSIDSVDSDSFVFLLSNPLSFIRNRSHHHHTAHETDHRNFCTSLLFSFFSLLEFPFSLPPFDSPLTSNQTHNNQPKALLTFIEAIDPQWENRLSCPLSTVSTVHSPSLIHWMFFSFIVINDCLIFFFSIHFIFLCLPLPL
jgi:hypothetical protein